MNDTITGVKRVKLRLQSHSETAEIKREIQRVAREVVILRDGGCVFRVLPGHTCSGYRNDGELILQADHLIPRNNSATYADTRLIVCVCMGIHGWKSAGGNARKAQYDAMVKRLLPPARAKLWEQAEADKYRPHRMGTYDWLIELTALNAELAALKKK
jgi:hypothetical protein